MVAQEELCAGHVVRLRRDRVQMPDGQEADREVVEHPGAVAIVPLDELERVLMIRQYRHPAQRQLWELPAGLRDVPGEPLLVTAQRELIEEAGYRAGDWRVLTDFLTSPGISTERLRVFLARNLTLVPEGERRFVARHEEAHLKVEWVLLERVVAAILAGALHNGVMAIGVLAAHAARQDGFASLRAPDALER